jgi:hypothetical protein
MSSHDRAAAFRKRQHEKGLVYIHCWVPDTHQEKFKKSAKRAVKKHLMENIK